MKSYYLSPKEIFINLMRLTINGGKYFDFHSVLSAVLISVMNILVYCDLICIFNLLCNEYDRNCTHNPGTDMGPSD